MRTTGEIAEQAARQGLWAMPLSACYLGDEPRPGLVLGYGGTGPRRSSTASAGSAA